MSCEMCGKFAGPELIECEIDGAKMFLCPSCTKFGTKMSDKTSKNQEGYEDSEVTFIRNKPGEKGPSISHVKVKTSEPPSMRTPIKNKRRDDLVSETVLVDNYGEFIKKTRLAMGLSLEDFGQMINEKTSLLQKIERSEFNPPEKLVKKIERKLNITLREEAAAPIYTGLSSTKEVTLGDVMKLKKKKRD